jgi:hypothetical protein
MVVIVPASAVVGALIGWAVYDLANGKELEEDVRD